MKTITKLILLLSIITAASSITFAADIPTEKKAEFRKLIIKRNQMHKELHTLDMQAADLFKQKKDTTRVNGKQVTVQDRMDLNQLHLETMAARYELDIPDLPDLTKKLDTKDGKSVYGADAFKRGRTRTMLELKRQTFVLLRSIDYSIILSRLQEN
jgi:hypothetical protein